MQNLSLLCELLAFLLQSNLRSEAFGAFSASRIDTEWQGVYDVA